MVTLSEIADQAAGSDVPITELLRRLKVIASRADLPPLAGWVNLELGGYPDAAALPTYRGPFPTDVRGQFSGPYGSGASNVPIPPAAFQEQVRESLFTLWFTNSVAEIEELASSQESVLWNSWPSDAIAGYHYFLQQGVTLGNGLQELVGAKKAIPRSMIVGILAAVRDRVLDLALELERIHPDVSAAAKEVAVRSQQIQSITAIVYGNAAIGSKEFEQIVRLDTPSSRDDLIDKLRALGFGDSELSELNEAIDEDGAANQGKSSVGKKVSGWLQTHSDKAVGAAIGAAASEGGKASAAVVAQLVQSFLLS